MHEQLSIDKQATVQLQGRASSLLAVDPLGIIVAVPHTRSEAMDGSGQLGYESYYQRIETEHIDASQVHAKKMVVNELLLVDGDSDGRSHDGDAGVKHTGNILITRQVRCMIVHKSSSTSSYYLTIIISS